MLLTIHLEWQAALCSPVCLPQGDYHCQEHSGICEGMEVNFKKSFPLSFYTQFLMIIGNQDIFAITLAFFKSPVSFYRCWQRR